MAATDMKQILELRKQLQSNGDDDLQHLIKDIVQQLMAAEVDKVSGAEHGARSGDRDFSH